MTHRKTRRSQHKKKWVKKQDPEKLRADRARWKARWLATQDPEQLRAQGHHDPEALRMRQRAYRLRVKYRMTLDDYERMYVEQDGCCAICGDLLDPPHIDHCHQSDRVRKMLCMPCNTGLGFFRDSADLLRLAATYLDEHAAPDDVPVEENVSEADAVAS